MAENLIAKASIDIKATPAEVWHALTDPAMIKQYLFGTTVECDWKEGSAITYRGEWQGKAYEDKGTIMKIEPEHLLETTYWSSLGGKEDKPENYNLVRYELEPVAEGTKLTITQDNNATEEARAHSEQNWNMVLQTIKKLLESEK